MKEALTFTIIAGNRSCSGNCLFCISKMTPDFGLGYKIIGVDWSKFDKSVKTASIYGAKTVLITGKGEPTLFPAQISEYLIRLYNSAFVRKELQTNGFTLAKGGLYYEFLKTWKALGLDIISISLYHYNAERNVDLFGLPKSKAYDIAGLIKLIHEAGMEVRLSCNLAKGYIDSIDRVIEMMLFAKANRVFQLTFRNIGKAKTTLDAKAAHYADSYRLSNAQEKKIDTYLRTTGKLCDILPHGASVYDIDGQNVCITTCLTDDGGEDSIRHLVFFPQGWLTTSWENVMGGRIL